MATYRFPGFNLDLINPTISINGQVGTSVVDGMATESAYADLVFTTPNGSKFGFRLEHNSKPVDWTIESLTAWVGLRLQEYIVVS
jgi:hypothetical protein